MGAPPGAPIFSLRLYLPVKVTHPMSDAAIWQNDARSLSALLAENAITPDDLLEMYLARCEKLEPELNAFVRIDREGSRRQAAESTTRRANGRPLSPLDGVPVSIKDNLYAAGLRASWGSLLLADNVAPRDDIVVERLRAAGAVIVGKTTTPEFALLGRTESKLTGYTRNPWNPALTPGGSSGGAVASVAAAMAPLAIGTDAGGSTRMPAGYTGLVGLRPSNGRVPRRYGFPPMALDFQAIGLIGRTVDDIELLLTVVGQPDARDPASVNLPPVTLPAGPLRIGWFTAIEGESCDAEVLSAHAEARRALEDAGHTLLASPPPFDIAELRDIWGVLTAAGAARAARRLENWQEKLTPAIAGLVERGLAISAADYVDALDRLQEFRAVSNAAWGDYDTLLIPTAPAPAWPIEAPYPSTIGGRPGSDGHQGVFCGWVNALGYCGLNVPGRPHPDGRPIGLQIVARTGHDGTALRIARDLEAKAPWSDRWPALAMSA